MAGSHRFHAVNVALEETLRASISAPSAKKGMAEEAGHKPFGPEIWVTERYLRHQ